MTPALRGRQGRVLLAYLVVNRGRPVSRDELIDAIWPESPPADPPAALRTQLSRLRSALGAKALAGRDAIELQLPENTWIDIEAAEHAIQAAEAALSAGDWKDGWVHAHIALNISGRPLLAGFEAPWVEEVRRELTELQMRARESIARAGVGLGGSELASAERSARELIRGAPFRESGYLNLMKALAASGNTAEALRTYEGLRNLLSEELGTAPGAEVQALHRRLLVSGAKTPPLSPGVETPSPPGPQTATDVLPLPTWLTPRHSSPFVGRVPEQARLEELWEEASEGDRQIVLVGGEPGVGKTRLATRHAKRVHEAGARVLYGRADEDTSVTFQPFVEAIRHWALNAPVTELRRDLGPHASVLARLVPEITARMPHPPQSDQELARDRFFDAVTGTLAAIGAANPTLLVLDDLHWADSGSLLMLRHIARSPHRARLMILGTYRETEVGDTLAETLADLGRETLFQRIPLGGLGADDVGALVTSIVGGHPDPELARTIHAETEGNPFLVEALVHNLPEDASARAERPASPASTREAIYAGGIPNLVREAVAHRAAELGDDVERVLALASVIGREFEAGLLVEASGMPSETVIQALEAAVTAGLLVDAPGTLDGYGFSHALFRQTVYAGMSKARRANLHLRVAEALEQRHGTDPRHVAELARHFAGAGPAAAPKAVEYCVRAGAGALGTFAYEEAIEHYSRALATIEPATSSDEKLVCEILLALGEAEWRAGLTDAARETFARAARIARRSRDADALGRAALGFCGYSGERFGLRDKEGEELLEEAIEAEPADTVLRSRLRARLAEALYFSHELDRSAELSELALETARKSGDRAALAAALVGRWYACFRPEGLEERVQLSDELDQLAPALHDRDLSIEVGRLRVILSLERAEVEGLDQAIQEHARLSDQSKQASNQLHSRAFRAMRALMDGSFAEVESLAGEVLEFGAIAQSPSALHYSALDLYLVRWEQGRVAEMEGALRDLIAQFSTPAWRAALALLCAEVDRTDEARDTLSELAKDGFSALPRDATWLWALGFLALTCAKLDDSKRGGELYELLLPFDGRIVMAGGAGLYSSSTSHYLGVLAALDGRPEDAVNHLENAVKTDRRTGARPWLANSEYQLALALHARGKRGDRAQARELLSEAMSTAHELGMNRLSKLAQRSERKVSASA